MLKLLRYLFGVGEGHPKLKKDWERTDPFRCRVDRGNGTSPHRVNCAGLVSWLLSSPTSLPHQTKVTVKRVTTTHVKIVKQGWEE